MTIPVQFIPDYSETLLRIILLAAIKKRKFIYLTIINLFLLIIFLLLLIWLNSLNYFIFYSHLLLTLSSFIHSFYRYDINESLIEFVMKSQFANLSILIRKINYLKVILCYLVNLSWIFRFHLKFILLYFHESSCIFLYASITPYKMQYFFI